jgi:hypothetical protein
VRGITGTLAILFIAGYFATTLELPKAWSQSSPSETRVTDGWRRTASGWQWHEAWKHPRAALDPPPVAWRIHPLLVASLQVLVSLFALVWADPRWSDDYAAARAPDESRGRVGDWEPSGANC